MNHDVSELSNQEYIQQKKTLQSSSECMEQYLNEYEELLHYMFCNKEWSVDMGLLKQLRVMSYCLSYYCITPSQLLATGISPMNKTDSERVYLGRLVQKGLMKGERVELCGETVRIFSLTAEGGQWCYEQLMRYQGEGRLVVSNSALDYVYKRFKQFHSDSYSSHFISVRDLNAFLLSCDFDGGYHYFLETYVKRDGQVLSVAEKLSMAHKRRARSDIAFVSDAYLKANSHRYQGYLQIFVEQDMSTQRRNVISGKFNAYTNILANTCEYKELTSVLFCIQSKETAISSYKKVSSKKLPSGETLLPLLPILGFSVFGDDWEECSLSEYVALISSYLEEQTIMSKRYHNVLKALETEISHRGDISCGEFLGSTLEQTKEYEGHVKDAFLKRHNELYCKRRAIFRSIAQTSVDTQTMFWHGFSICTSPNRNHAGVFPFLYPDTYASMRTDLYYLCRRYFDVAKDTAAYEPFYDNTATCGFGLKNHYIFDSNFHLFVENISDDFGGLSRVGAYLDKVSFPGVTGVLLCFVDHEENLKGEFSSFLQSNYATMLSVGNSVPLKVVFMPYRTMHMGLGLMEITADRTYDYVTL